MPETTDPTVGPDDPALRLEEASELLALARDTAVDAQAFVDAVIEIAAGRISEAEISLILLPLSKLLLTGARLGANRDVVPSERFEPDTGPDPELDPLRAGLANYFEGVDEYADVVDPMTDPEIVRGLLSDDLTAVAADLLHGLRHYRSGRIDEALWWFQFSYLSTWGARAASALRVLQSMVSHLRLDVDDDTVADAEFDALHAH